MGGGIAAAFAVQFPHLVSGKVGLVASAGVVEVRCFRVRVCVRLRVRLRVSRSRSCRRWLSLW